MAAKIVMQIFTVTLQMIFNDAECRWFYNAFASQIVSVLVDTKSMKITAKYTSEGALTDIKIEKANISEITAPINTATEKIFYWESFESMKPIELKQYKLYSYQMGSRQKYRFPAIIIICRKNFFTIIVSISSLFHMEIYCGRGVFPVKDILKNMPKNEKYLPLYMQEIFFVYKCNLYRLKGSYFFLISFKKLRISL